MLHEEFHLCGGNRASCSGVLIVVNVLLQYRDRSTGTPLLIDLSEFIAPVNSPNAIMPDDQVAPPRIQAFSPQCLSHAVLTQGRPGKTE